MIINRLKTLLSWIKEKALAAWTWTQEHAPVARDKAQATTIAFLTEPLSESEYALLRRISAIVGTSAALYLIAVSGVASSLIVIGICIAFALAVYKITGIGRLQRSMTVSTEA